MRKEKAGGGKISKTSQFSPIKTETGKNMQPDQAITAGMVQSPVAALNASNVFDGRTLASYGEMEKPTERDLNIKRPDGATKGLSIDLATTGKQGEKAK
jgi:hypothetical protein